MVRVPDSLLGSETPGDLLKLTPHDGGTTIRLVARMQFRIGRSRAEADLLTRFQPETPENTRRTHELGRVQVFGEIIDGEVTLRDGNGTGPSANCSAFDGRPLAADVSMRLRQRGVLDLAGHYGFEVVPQFAMVEDVVIENFSAWEGATRSGFGSAVGNAPLVCRNCLLCCRCEPAVENEAAARFAARAAAAFGS